jgi:oligopeptidase B
VVLSVREETTERVQPCSRWRAWEPGPGGCAEPDFDEELGTSNLANAEFDSPIIRLSYTSFLTPPRVYDYVLATGDWPSARRPRSAGTTARSATSPSDSGRRPRTAR